MIVQVIENNEVIWEYGECDGIMKGIACTSYIADGTQQKIIDALNTALDQAVGEKEVFPNSINCF